MSKSTQWIDQKFYPDCGNNWDDELFRQRILAKLQRNSVVLDLGAGAGIVKQMNFKGLARKVCGVDIDPRVKDNPLLDERRHADAGFIPYAEGMFDVVFSDNVLEHLENPAAVFREVQRVLKRDGMFLFKTPNKWHYVPTIARLTPHAVHRMVVRGRGRVAEDVLPTLYRANSKSAIAHLARLTGFDVMSIEYIERRPEYLRMNAATYLVGVAYERFVNSSEVFAPLRIILIGQLQKSTSSSPQPTDGRQAS